MPSDIERSAALYDKAMETERDGMKFYEEAAAKVKDPEAKAIFKMLAAAERGHLKQIEGAKAATIRTYSTHDWKGGFVAELGKEIEAIGRLELPKITDKTESATVLDAVNTGIKLEEASIAFYTNARAQVSDIGVGNLFGSLVLTERVHLFLLQVQKDAITKAKY
jgi:rubrerythrin